MFSIRLVLRLFSRFVTAVRRRRVSILAGVSSIDRLLVLVMVSTVCSVISAPFEFILFRRSCRTGWRLVRLVKTLLSRMCRFLARANGRWVLKVLSNLFGCCACGFVDRSEPLVWCRVTASRAVNVLLKCSWVLLWVTLLCAVGWRMNWNVLSSLYMLVCLCI